MKFFLVVVVLIGLGGNSAAFAGYLPPDYGQPCRIDGHDGHIDERGYCRRN